MHTIIVGGGLLGLSAGYYLAREGHRVTVLEASSQLGGLATDVEVAGIRVDRFYHCILNADHTLLELIDEVGLREQIRMHPVRAGFFTGGKTYPISSPADLLRFPPLGPLQRLRLVRSLLACRRVKDWTALEQVDVETWLRRQSSDAVFETVWRPLLSAKFDGNFGATPATYIWSRTVRMTDTRSAGGAKELAGHLVGGYRTLAERLAVRIRELGGDVCVGRPVREIVTHNGAIQAVVTADGPLTCDAAILTTPLPLTAKLLRGRDARGLELASQSAEINRYATQVEEMQGYLGVLCVLLMLRRPLSPYYTLYLADDTLPFTAVIESTNLIDPQHVGDTYLVYLPKYLDPASELFTLPDERVRAWFLEHLRRVYPDLRDDDIIAAPVFRAPHVEPLHPLGSFGTVPPTRTPVQGLWIGSTKHFYPRLNNGDAVCHLGAQLAAQVATPASSQRLVATAG